MSKFMTSLVVFFASISLSLSVMANQEEVPEDSRKVMSSMFILGNKIRKINQKSNRIRDELIFTEEKIKVIAAKVGELEQKVKNQKELLYKRLVKIYKLRKGGVALSSGQMRDPMDLERFVKYLKLITNYDSSLISSVLQNQDRYEKRKSGLMKKVKNLLVLKKDMKIQKKNLLKEEKKKNRILAKIRKTIRMKEISGLSPGSMQVYLSEMFFERKGTLKLPIEGSVVRKYGMIKNRSFGYLIRNKGLKIKPFRSNSVSAVFDGNVDYVGYIPGYGQTVIIDHADNYYSVYANLNQSIVKIGERIAEGQSIAQVNIDHSKKFDYLYFELRHFSDPLNPKYWISTK